MRPDIDQFSEVGALCIASKTDKACISCDDVELRTVRTGDRLRRRTLWRRRFWNIEREQLDEFRHGWLVISSVGGLKTKRQYSERQHRERSRAQTEDRQHHAADFSL